MMKSVRSIRCIKMIALVVPMILAILLAQSYIFVPYNNNTQRLRDFYSLEENSLDVVFIGASEVFSGYAPGYAYDAYGFTSYMYAMESNQGSLYQAQLKEVLAHQSPEIIVIEVFGFLRAVDQSLYEEARLRMFVDNIPMSENKVNTIMEHPYEDKVSCFLPFIKYHGDLHLAKTQLSQMLSGASGQGPSPLMGMSTQTAIYDGTDSSSTSNPSPYIADKCVEHLVDLLVFCQQEELDNVIFVNFPRHLSKDPIDPLLARVNQVRDIVTQYGFDFLDLQDNPEELGLDFSRDFFNSHHLNIYGQFKVTDYFGNLFINDYGLTPLPQSAASVAFWNSCASAAGEYYALADQAIREGQFFHLNADADEWKNRNAA